MTTEGMIYKATIQFHLNLNLHLSKSLNPDSRTKPLIDH